MKTFQLLKRLIPLIFLIFINQTSFAIDIFKKNENKEQKTITVEDSAKIERLLIEANVFKAKNNLLKAIEKAKEAQVIAESSNYLLGRYRVYRALEDFYSADNRPIQSKNYQLKALNIKSKVRELDERELKNEKDRVLIQQQRIIEQEQAELRRKLQEIEKLTNDKSISKQELERRKQELLNKQSELNNQSNTINLQNEQIRYTSAELSETKQELENQRLTAKILDDSFKITKQNELLLNKDLEKRSLLNYVLILVVSFFIVISAGIYRLYFLKKNNQSILENKNTEIETQKKRSDDLLLNILPENVANELKVNGKAEPKFFDIATIMFTDFKDFTLVSEKISPRELVELIDFIFRKFDEITGKYHLEKIKTIGDAYLCASGIPDPSTHNPLNVIRAAQEIEEFIDQLVNERKKKNLQFFEIRIGINSGPIVAGIVGAKKFAYDIWGDAVNIAARMEQNSLPGKINISGATYELVKDQIKCEHRGKILAKNKGEIDMYFVVK